MQIGIAKLIHLQVSGEVPFILQSTQRLRQHGMGRRAGEGLRRPQAIY
jgi:hypothetical protein